MTILDLLLAFAALALALLCAAGVVAELLHFRRRGPGPPGAPPRVSILKPCKGEDPDLYENLSSWARLEGAPGEVLIGFADPADPAAEIARRVAGEHPDRVRVICAGLPADPIVNPKVHILRALQREATGEVLLVSDSNVRAPPDALLQLLAPLADPRTAASYALFVSPPGATLGARLESALFSTVVLPAIAGAYRLFGSANLIGKAMAVRRSVLQSLGGWARYATVLVEDGCLGHDLRRQGHRIALVDGLVEVRLGKMTLRQLWDHELRWMMLHRVRKPLVPLGMALWNPWFLAIAAAVAHAAGLATAPPALLAAAVFNGAIKLVPFLRRGGRLSGAWVLPLMEALMLAVEVAVWWQREVRWRGQRFRLGRGSRILSVRPDVPAPRPWWWTVPNLVTLSRLFLAPVLLVLAYAGESRIFLALFCVSLLTDVADGELARRLGQASEKGARLDSWADFATYTTVPLCAYWLKPALLRDEALSFWLIAGSMVVPKLYGFAKFRKLTGYHTRGAVISAYIVGTATVLMFADVSIWPFRIAALLVLPPKLEEMAITTVLPRQVTMVRSLRRALELRREILQG